MVYAAYDHRCALRNYLIEKNLDTSLVGEMYALDTVGFQPSLVNKIQSTFAIIAQEAAAGIAVDDLLISNAEEN
jgi:hypothetical protein